VGHVNVRASVTNELWAVRVSERPPSLAHVWRSYVYFLPRSEVSWRTKFVALAVGAIYMNSEGRCHVSVTTIGKCGIGRKSAGKHLALLDELGLLRRTLKPGSVWHCEAVLRDDAPAVLRAANRVKTADDAETLLAEQALQARQLPLVNPVGASHSDSAPESRQLGGESQRLGGCVTATHEVASEVNSKSESEAAVPPPETDKAETPPMAWRDELVRLGLISGAARTTGSSNEEALLREVDELIAEGVIEDVA
jgi:hypothetical protein